MCQGAGSRPSRSRVANARAAARSPRSAAHTMTTFILTIPSLASASASADTTGQPVAMRCGKLAVRYEATVIIAVINKWL